MNSALINEVAGVPMLSRQVAWGVERVGGGTEPTDKLSGNTESCTALEEFDFIR